MLIFLEVTKKKCIKGRYPHLKVKIWQYSAVPWKWCGWDKVYVSIIIHFSKQLMSCCYICDMWVQTQQLGAIQKKPFIIKFIYSWRMPYCYWHLIWLCQLITEISPMTLDITEQQIAFTVFFLAQKTSVTVRQGYSNFFRTGPHSLFHHSLGSTSKYRYSRPTNAPYYNIWGIFFTSTKSQ